MDFRNANLIAYDFSELNYDRTDFGNSFLNTANMMRASFSDSVFRNTFLRAANMTRTCFRSSIFDDCSLDRADGRVLGVELPGEDFAEPGHYVVGTAKPTKPTMVAKKPARA